MALSPPNEGLDFQRPQGWRFAFQGVNLRDVPDALPPTKFASAKNIRATPTESVQTRPGYTLLFSTGGLSVTDLKAYATVGQPTFTPRFLARDSSNQIWLDNGTLVATLTGSPSFGATMLPFRPSESPQTWMYVAGAGDYQKISAPDPVSGLTTAYKVGIAEPQTPVDASPFTTGYLAFTGAAAAWTPSGVMGALVDSNRTVDTAGVVFADPLTATRFYVQTTVGIQYGIGEILAVNGSVPNALVEDVFPEAPNMLVRAIRYASGSTGKCVIALGQVPTTGVQLIGLRRNSIIQFNPPGGEFCLVTSVITGPDGSIALETSTAGTITPGTTIRGRPSITVTVATITQGQTVNGPIIVSNSTGTGLAIASQTLANSPFAIDSGVGTPESEDYIHISLKVEDPTKLNEIKVLFNIGGESPPAFTQNYFYYSVQPSQLAPTVTNAQTQLQTALSELSQSTVPAGTALPDQSSAGQLEWTEILIPISALIRVGGDQTRSLEDCNGVQVIFNVTASMLVEWGAIWVGHQGQPDIGADGVEYRYRAVPRNSSTGVRGNATPPMRYGVHPRRQKVTVTLPSAAYDAQIDTWDIERYGGSVTSYRYIGSAPIAAASFIDNFGDAAALGGTLMEIDNFEPWPSIDVPFRVSTSAATITAVGMQVTVSGFTAWPATIARWLPGTLIQIGGQNAYTLRKRPTQLSSSSYLFDLEECTAQAVTPSYFWILEPKVARQPQLFTFGPDVEGTFFAVGDHLRPGTLSYSKSFAPDSAPDKYNLDLCPPSEVLITGFIKGGVALVASLKRWWALYPQFANAAQRYNPVEQAVGRGIAAPLGYFTDGATVYFWAKDGICTTDGGPHASLTDADLYNLFPHEGVPGVNVVRNGVTYYAPDYTNSGTFRLNKVNTYLFADYQDTNGVPRTLVCDLRTGGWVADFYNDPITVHVNITEEAPAVCLLADGVGKVYQEIDCTNDNGVKIACLVAPFEWDGGDLRAQPLFGDSYLDCVPQSVITAQPVSQGVAICPPTVIAATGLRTFAPISVQGGELQKFLGTVYTWSE